MTLLENNPLFNAGKGAVFCRDGTIELEASIMVTRGYRKSGVGLSLLSLVKNPIIAAKKMLEMGEKDDGGGAYGHCHLSGRHAEGLAEQWGCEIVDKGYFWTRKRWEEHRRQLEREKKAHGTEAAVDPLGYDGCHDDENEYLPQGTVGAVVLDRCGTVCVATSTGGMTNKLPGRVGDTPTLGAGFWAEEWLELPSQETTHRSLPIPAPLKQMLDSHLVTSLWAHCFSWTAPSGRASDSSSNDDLSHDSTRPCRRAVAMSGTGNGDSFLRTNAVRTAAAIMRFSSSPGPSLADALARVAGPHGELQRSAGDRWGATGEGQGGIIGIELLGNEGRIALDFNCGGMFRAWVNDKGEHRCMVFKEDY